MNKQLTWFLVAIIWAMVAVINSVQHRSPYLVTYNVLAGNGVPRVKRCSTESL